VAQAAAAATPVPRAAVRTVAAADRARVRRRPARVATARVSRAPDRAGSSPAPARAVSSGRVRPGRRADRARADRARPSARTSPRARASRRAAPWPRSADLAPPGAARAAEPQHPAPLNTTAGILPTCYRPRLGHGMSYRIPAVAVSRRERPGGCAAPPEVQSDVQASPSSQKIHGCSAAPLTDRTTASVALPGLCSFAVTVTT